MDEGICNCHFAHPGGTLLAPGPGLVWCCLALPLPKLGEVDLTEGGSPLLAEPPWAVEHPWSTDRGSESFHPL